MAIRKMAHADIPTLVELHIESFKESLNILAGKKYLSEVFTWFMNEGHIALVSETGNELTGYVIGAPIGYEKAMNRALWKFGAFGLLTNPSRIFNAKLINNIFKRIKSILGLTTLKSQPLVNELGFGISLVGIAVAERSKGSGNAKELVDAFEIAAKENNADFIRLSVLKENKRAQSFYTKMGWTEYEIPGGLYYFKKLK
jgi:ribosomal protein S18 acetylase RimI-like enzyme